MKKYNQIIAYGAMGILTTIINVIVFYICNEFWGLDYKMATTIAWLLSVIFAYITNKLFVFKSQTTSLVHLFKEMTSFLCFRVTSYFFDLILMIFLIEFINLEENLSKLIVNIFVVLFNYFVSKFYIFRMRN